MKLYAYKYNNTKQYNYYNIHLQVRKNSKDEKNEK